MSFLALSVLYLVKRCNLKLYEDYLYTILFLICKKQTAIRSCSMLYDVCLIVYKPKTIKGVVVLHLNMNV